MIVTVTVTVTVTETDEAITFFAARKAYLAGLSPWTLQRARSQLPRRRPFGSGLGSAGYGRE